MKKAWAHILYNSKIKDVEAMIDRSEPRKLNVNIKIPNSNSTKVDTIKYKNRNHIRMFNYYLMILHMHRKQKNT